MPNKRKSKSDWNTKDGFTKPCKRSRRSLSLDDLDKINYDNEPEYHWKSVLDEFNYIKSSKSNSKSTLCDQDKLMHDDTFESKIDSSNSFKKHRSYSSIYSCHFKTRVGTEDISKYPTPLCDCSDCGLQAMKTFCGDDFSSDDNTLQEKSNT